jgi:hypothetical protein
MEFHFPKFGVLAALVLGLSVAGCQSSPFTDTGGTGSAIGSSSASNGGGAFASQGLRLTAELVADHRTDEITGIETEVVRVACIEGEEFEPFEDRISSELLDMPFPGVAAGIEGVGFEGHLFADAFFVLDAGCYDVTSRVLGADGLPTDLCFEAVSAGVEVGDGRTTDVWLVNQCKGPPVGAMDVAEIINRPPEIEAFVYRPAKFIDCTAAVQLCASASDPDGDSLEFAWEQVGGPDLGELGAGIATTDEGLWESCLTLDVAESGSYQLKVSAYDLITLNGEEMRIEDHLATLGEPHPSRDDLQVPLYAACAAPPEEPTEGEEEPAAEPEEEPCPCPDDEEDEDTEGEEEEGEEDEREPDGGGNY